MPVQVIVRRVSKWYGVDPNREGVVNPVTAKDKLSKVILGAERSALKGQEDKAKGR